MAPRMAPTYDSKRSAPMPQTSPDVVADVVGDDRRVAGIVFGDSRFHLPDEVGAHVRGLGVDAAADTGEERDRGGAEAESRQDLEHLVLEHRELDAVHSRVEEIERRHSHDGEAHHRHPQHRPSGESDLERRGERLAGGVRRANVRFGRDLHSEIAGESGTGRADEEREPRSAPCRRSSSTPPGEPKRPGRTRQAPRTRGAGMPSPRIG